MKGTTSHVHDASIACLCHNSHLSAGSSMGCRCRGNGIFGSPDGPQAPLGGSLLALVNTLWLINSDPLSFSTWKKSWSLVLLELPCPYKPPSWAGPLKDDSCYLAHSPIVPQELHPGSLNGGSTAHPALPTLGLLVLLAAPARLSLQTSPGEKWALVSTTPST